MADPKETIQKMTDCGIAPVIRAESADQALKAVQAILAGGIPVIEITFTVPGAMEIIRELADSLGEQALLGAGTVLDPETAQGAISAGAEFIVAPNTNLQVIETTKQNGKVSIPGAFSPTEVAAAWQAGADLVKIFPASVLGPVYLKDLHGPMPDVPLMPTGGIDLDNVADYLKAGAATVGVGSSLVDKKAMKTGDYGVITEKAIQFVEIIRKTRQEMK